MTTENNTKGRLWLGVGVVGILLAILVPLGFRVQNTIMPEPIVQIYFYGSLVGLFHLAVIIVGLICAIPYGFYNWQKYVNFARGFTVFNLILWLVGIVMNVLWGTFVFGVVYTSTDYVFDFTPFFPITQAYIDRPWGNETGHIYYGLNILHVQGLWLIFAITTWICAILLYLRIRKQWNKTNALKASL